MKMWAFLAASVLAIYPLAARADDAQTVVRQAIDAMGGEARLSAIHAIDYTAVGERQMVEQSERPTGPYFVDHFHTHVIRDIAGDRARIETTHEGYASDHWWTTEKPYSVTLVINGEIAAIESQGTLSYAGGTGVTQNDDLQLFAPERLLLTALAARDLHELPDQTLHGMRHNVVAFTADGIKCVLSIGAQTHLPWQISYERAYPYQVFYNAWGDVPTTITFTAWALEHDGVSYPHEWTYERLHLPDQQFFIVDLNLHPQIDDTKLTIPHEILAAHQKPQAIDDYPLGYGDSGSPHELAPGVTEVPGGWNIAFVKQSDGVVMIEAPWSTGYTARTIAFAQKTYGMPVKAVITTSDSWPHIAGVREAVAQGITVYALDLNRPILERLLAAPHTQRPDTLARIPRAPHFIWVTDPTAVGSGSNALTIYPYRTVTGERQMMVYLASARLLYTSDLFSLADGPTDWFTPQYLQEAAGAIARYDLHPVTIFGMHYDATPYQALTDVLRTWTSSSGA
jgi:hypothetical protein